MTVAYQLEEAGTRLSRTTIERRPLGPRDVRLHFKFCGICHSDLVAASDKLGGGTFRWSLDTRWWVRSAR